MRGSQAPRVRVSPSWSETSGGDAGDLATAYGLAPDEWQQGILDDIFGETSRGRLTAGSAGIAVPRQNGKNAILEVVELFKIVIQGRKVLHTAHEVKTAKKAFRRLAGFFENEAKWPELAELLAPNGIRSTNGQESITLTNGGSVEFVARTRGSGRGYTVDDLVLDEAQELTDEQLEALLPTISSAPSGDPQQLYTGTPPGPRSVGEVLPRLRHHAVNGATKRVVWHEWSIPDDSVPAEAMRSWKESAYATNPALGHRLNIQTVTDEVAAMSPEGFCRERLGWWDTGSAGSLAIDPAHWAAAKIRPEDAPKEGRTCYAVRFSPDGALVALAAAVRPKEGPVHVEAICREPMSSGTDWLVDWLVERHRGAAQIVIDGKYGVGFLVQALKDRGVKNRRQVITPTTEQVIAAHSMFEQGLAQATMTTCQQDEVDEEASSAVKRDIGKDGGFGWAPGGDEGSVAMLEAMTHAHWAARTTIRKPGGSGGVMVL